MSLTTTTLSAPLSEYSCTPTGCAWCLAGQECVPQVLEVVIVLVAERAVKGHNVAQAGQLPGQVLYHSCRRQPRGLLQEDRLNVAGELQGAGRQARAGEMEKEGKY